MPAIRSIRRAADVAIQHCARADVLARRIENREREPVGVAQPDIEALPRDRMQRLRRIAERDAARARCFPCEFQHQRKGAPIGDGRETRQARSKLVRKVLEKRWFVLHQPLFREFRRHRPHETVVVALGKERDRTRGCESFPGDAAGVGIGAHLCDHRHLIVIVPLPRCAGENATRSVRDRDEARDERLAIASGLLDRGIGGGRADRLHRRLVPDRHFRMHERGVERCLQCAIARDVAERGQTDVGGGEPRHAEASGLRHVDLGDRRHRAGRGRELLPHTLPLEDEARAVRQRERAVAAQRLPFGAGVEHDDVEVGVAQRQRQRCAHGPRADDHDVMHGICRRGAPARQ